MDDLFSFDEIRVRQPARMLAGRASYEILDHKRLLAVATETEARTVLDKITRLMPDTRALAVTTAAGDPVFTLAKQDSKWLAELIDPLGETVGKIKVGGSRRQYTLLDEKDQVMAEAIGDLACKRFIVASGTGHDRAKFAEVRKTWAGPVKEALTSADHYAVKFTAPVEPRLRTLTVMVPIVLDLVRYGPT